VVYDSTDPNAQVLWSTDIRGSNDVRVHQADVIQGSYIYTSDGSSYEHVYWRSDREGGVHGGSDCVFDTSRLCVEMEKGYSLGMFEYLCDNGNAILGFDTTGDFALMDVSGPKLIKIWCAGTSGTEAQFSFERNGDLVVYDAQGNVLWKQPTSPDPSDLAF